MVRKCKLLKKLRKVGSLNKVIGSFIIKNAISAMKKQIYIYILGLMNIRIILKIKKITHLLLQNTN